MRNILYVNCLASSTGIYIQSTVIVVNEQALMINMWGKVPERKTVSSYRKRPLSLGKIPGGRKRSKTHEYVVYWRTFYKHRRVWVQ